MNQPIKNYGIPYSAKVGKVKRTIAILLAKEFWQIG